MTTSTTSTQHASVFQRLMIMPKILYFWLSMAIYTANGLASLHYRKTWGMTNSTIGFLMALQGVNFIGAILWTNLADRIGNHKYILSGATMLSTICFAINGAPKMLNYKFASSTTEIIYACVTMTLVWLFQSALFPLLDCTMIALLTKNPSFTKDQFGFQRLFGSPAHVIATILAGYTKKFDTWKEVLYVLNAFISSSIFAALVVLFIPRDLEVSKTGHGHGGKDEKKDSAVQVGEVDMGKKDGRSPVVRLLTDPVFMFFMLFVTSAGLLANTLTIFQPLLVNDHQKSDNPLLVAATKIPACISEITVYATSKMLTAQLGFYWLLLFSQFAGLCRIFSYHFVTKDREWLPFIIELFKGMNSGFIVSSGVRISAEIALPGTATTAQGLFSGNYKGLSMSLAGVIGGILLIVLKQNIGALFKIIGSFALFTTACFFVKFLFFDRVIGLPGFPRKEKKSSEVVVKTLKA